MPSDLAATQSPDQHAAELFAALARATAAGARRASPALVTHWQVRGRERAGARGLSRDSADQRALTRQSARGRAGGTRRARATPVIAAGPAQNTTRNQTVTLAVKAGAAAATGAQVPPSADSDYVPLFVVTVAYGQAAITASNIAQHPSAPFLQANLANMPARLPGVVGAARNAKMLVATASATATFTADEITVETALGGVPWRLGNFSEGINLATIGAGGMDSGSAPVSGYVALYAIYNPTTGAAALLGTNATSSIAPNIYGGTAMPSGYIASALVSVWQTNASGLLVAAYQTDRAIYNGGSTALVTTTQQAEGSYAAFSAAGAVPMNAKSCTGSALITTNASQANLFYALAGSATGVGVIGGVEQSAQTNGGLQGSMGEIPIITPQTLYYYAVVSSGTMTFNVNISGYRI